MLLMVVLILGGGIEAIASKLIAEGIDRPIAHSPLETEDYEYLWNLKVIVEPKIAPEMVSICFLHCILKGLHKAPRIDSHLGEVKDADVLISPMGCWGKPHKICEKNGIPIIVIKENTTILHEKMGKSCIYVNNYLEAIGVIQAMKIGVTLESLQNKVNKTKIIRS